MENQNMRVITIVGTGLIGTSFALALKHAGFGGELIAVSSPPAVDAAIRLGAISHGVTLDQAAAVSDLIYLAQPVDRILNTIPRLGPLVRACTLITDAGSTKLQIMEAAARYLPPGSFLGGHPMAGKEQRGAAAADRYLFRGRPYVLTPAESGRHALDCEFRNWLVRIGASIFEISAAQHDSAVAFTSHLPQLLSTTLAETLRRGDSQVFRRIFGPGLVDMTRLALSDSALWESILATNREQVLCALDAFLNSLGEIRKRIETGSAVAPFFSSAAGFASAIRSVAGNGPEQGV
jgi:prephenate dehydrogenase